MSMHNSLEHFHNAFIYLSQIGYADVPATYDTTYCLRDMHIIHYVREGRGYVTIGEKTYDVQGGEGFYIPPNCAATYGSYEDAPWKIYYFAFNGCYADELISNTIYKNNHYVEKIENGEELVEIIRLASEKIKTHNYPQLFGLEQLFRLLPFITKETTTNVSTAKGNYLTLCKDYIDRHYNENLQVSDVAKAVNLSVNYIYRIFKEMLHMSPHDYLTSVRMQYAKKYLIETELSTHEIALHLGYVNYTTFYSTFNKKMHMSPHEYRLLQTSEQTKVEQNGATTIRIFKKIEDCYFLESMAIKELSTEEDIHFHMQWIPQSTYLRRLQYKNKEYDLYAYVYEKQEHAKQYFMAVSETTIHNSEFEFKIRHTSAYTMLVVMSGHYVYKLVGGELKDFNEFRHALNHIFQKILLN